jgi:hypothetical protein
MLLNPIHEEEIVKDISKQEWCLGKSIRMGGFGEYFAGDMSKINFLLRGLTSFLSLQLQVSFTSLSIQQMLHM